MEKSCEVDFSKMYERAVLMKVLLKSYEGLFLRREDLDKDEVEAKDTLFYHIQECADELTEVIAEEWNGR